MMSNLDVETLAMGDSSMAASDFETRLELLETRVAEIQATLVAGEQSHPKNWRAAVQKYAGDEDLLAVFAQAKKLRDAERSVARKQPSRRSKP